MLMSACLPIPVGPGVIAEGRSISKLLFTDPGTMATERGIIFERRAGYWVMAMREPEKATKAHYSIGYSTGHLFNQQVINLTYDLVAQTVDLCALDIFAGDQSAIWMCRWPSKPPVSFKKR